MLAEADLVVRAHGAGDQRLVLLNLTARAEHYLADLSAVHLDELEKMRPILDDMLSLMKQ